jgi:hypothetical protein
VQVSGLWLPGSRSLVSGVIIPGSMSLVSSLWYLVCVSSFLVSRAPVSGVLCFGFWLLGSRLLVTLVSPSGLWSHGFRLLVYGF